MKQNTPSHSLLSAFLIVVALGGSARSDFYYIPNGYHAQQSTYYCGEAAMQMMLDSPSAQAWNPGLPSQDELYAVSRSYNTQPTSGTDPWAIADTMNFYSSPIYYWSGFAPTDGDAASRTLAESLVYSGIPSSVEINHGGHWIDVNGVTANSPIAIDQAYQITGFFIRDPWPWSGTLGANTWLAYNNRAWFSVFNPEPSNPFVFGPSAGQFVMVDAAYLFLVANGSSGSTTPAPSIPPSELTASQAITVTASDLAADSALNTRFGFTHGGFDPNPADALLLQLPGDSSTQGDWLIAYDGSGGSNDVTGALVINADTGTIDQATWIDSSQAPMTLGRVQQMLQDQYSGNLVRDEGFASLAPEPSSALLFGVGSALLFLRLRAARLLQKKGPPVKEGMRGGKQVGFP